MRYTPGKSGMKMADIRDQNRDIDEHASEHSGRSGRADISAAVHPS